jgi:hypothetical protein
MLRGDFVPASDDAALEQTKSGFYRVCVNVSTDVFSRAVFYSFMLCVGTCFENGFLVRRVFIGDDHTYVFTDVIVYASAEKRW